MAKNLVIVESPAKARTIEKFLGNDYKVMSSFGHIRDLPTRGMSIDIAGDFQPAYEVPDDKKKLVAELRKAAAAADTVWLASDEDREGEAIAWHLAQVLGLDVATTRRIVFHEITKPAILAAIANPRTIDVARVDAQQARRVLDRIVGFELSPVLWKKIKPMLSAGRVQSVALRLLCEREAEVKAFTPEQYWRVSGRFSTAAGHEVRGDFSRRLHSEQEARAFVASCAEGSYTVADVQVRPIVRQPAPPFTTSTLQQEASRQLNMSVAMTMMVAQRLYEAGHITYMRTDSLNLSQTALADISATITGTLGKQYLQLRRYHTSSKGAQEAHEAIRPTYIAKETIDMGAAEQRLYTLIRRRTLASQMADARLERTNVEIVAEAQPNGHFTATGEVVVFDGFLRAWAREDEAPATQLPRLAVGETLRREAITATERYTQAPARYNEGSLVKKLEELGIGRPSTYAPTISTIQGRDYVVRGDKEGERRAYASVTLTADGNILDEVLTERGPSERGRLIPTDIGIIVNDFLTEHFPDILDYDFTARMESEFDDIAEGKRRWNDEIKEFYTRFHPNIERVTALKSEQKVGERLLGTDPATGDPVSAKISRFGPVVQIGSTNAEVRPRFASLRPDQSVFTITLEEALKLFELPRTLGEYEGKPVKAAVGRFGPYVSGAGLFASIPKDMSPMTITYDEAVKLIEEKREKNANRVIRTFDEDPEMSVLRGRFGPYIEYKKQNYKIPKTLDAEALTLEECRQIIAEAPAPKQRRTTRRTTTRKG